MSTVFLIRYDIYGCEKFLRTDSALDCKEGKVISLLKRLPQKDITCVDYLHGDAFT